MVFTTVTDPSGKLVSTELSEAFRNLVLESELVIKGKLNASGTRCAGRLGEACSWFNF